MTIEELRSSAELALATLLSAWTQLRSIVAYHETTLNKRWLKKTVDQRKNVLLSAWPEIPEKTPPEFDMLRRKKTWKLKLGRSFETAEDRAARFPHINLEDLLHSDRLLRMISSRCREHPSKFTNTDRNSIEFGMRIGCLRPEHVLGYNIDLHGYETTYGHITAWAQDPKGFFKYVLGLQPEAGVGLMITQIQRDILQFLVRCSTILLHDICLDDLEALDPKPSCSQTSLSTNNHISETMSLAADALEAPYNVPDTYAFERLQSFADARFCEAQDHLLLLREDPGYFVEQILEQISETKEFVVIHRHQLKQKLSQWGYDKAIASMLLQAYDDLFFWDTILRTVGELRAQSARYTTEIRPGCIVPEQYSAAFSQLTLLTDTIERSYASYTLQALLSAPSFAQCWDIVIPAGTSGAAAIESVAFRRRPQTHDHLWWLLNNILDFAIDEEQYFDLPELLEEVGYVIIKDPSQNARLTSRLTRVISHLSVVAEIQRQLSLSTCNGKHCHDQSVDNFPKWADENLTWREELRQATESNDSDLGLARLVMDLKIYDHPSDRKRTAATTAKMRSAEAALDFFWEEVDRAILSKSGKTLKDLERGLLPQRDMERTPVWQEPARKTAPGTDYQPKAVLDTTYALALLEERSESTIDRSQPTPARIKVKSRGTAATTVETTEAPTPDTKEDEYLSRVPLSPKIPVRKKALSTFSVLFGKPINGNTPSGEIPWMDFRKAMANIGFSAEKLQGSAWLFKKPEDSGSRSIIFHEPHPESKLCVKWVRRMAGRLQRRFGWTAESFVLTEGES